MTDYFSDFSLNKITNSIASAAHKTQDTLSQAISNVNLRDPHANLSIKTRTRYLQELLGTVDEISKLPPQYESLEKKTDALEKSCRRVLTVTKTFELEGYDYPPNLTESISDWWSFGKEGWFGTSSKKPEKGSINENEKSEPFMPRSFAQALSKAAHDSSTVFLNSAQVDHSGEQAAKNDVEADFDEDFADAEDVKKMLETFSVCYKNIDENKHEMDTSIAKEFNTKLEKLINEDFKKVHELRKKVEDSRLKFDTVLYEIKLKRKKLEEKSNALSNFDKKINSNGETEGSEISQNGEAKKEAIEDTNVSASKVEAELKDEVKTEVKDNKKAGGEQETEALSEDDKLLEQLEDEFVSNTTAAVEVMGEITDCSELLSLLKLFQNFQLVYYRQCVVELENSLKSLTELEDE
ncbi:hypothetical protein HG535_0B02170 [Zygotorulaspora mrakii]|uniref:Uncharacterized protein n=1 Tax=Zygotorulaspora mrakii TaxID=42260 RepID=A0A7H9AZM6_ZYGMR|nr:uncharacterized protein HG535_0B02170 [Zygotorulaspora mrakii]QLG71179.1 hypothetical protein HG535_0B02170 [Zygotorulaspora mrakii]